MQEIVTLYRNKQYDEILKRYLKRVKEIKYGSDERKREKNVELLYYLFGVCAEQGFYLDSIDVLKKLHELRPICFTKWTPEELRFILNAIIEALIYCLINNQIDKLNIKYDIVDEIEKAIVLQDQLCAQFTCANMERQKELRTLYEDYKSGKLPIYTIAFLYPFDPIVPNYVFDLSGCFPYISFEVSQVKRDDDSLTEYKFKAYGFINTRMDWEGPRWSDRTRFHVVAKSLSIVNLMLLHAVKASPGKMITPFSVEQVSTISSVFQYRYDGIQSIEGGLVTGTDFRAHWIGNNAKWHEFTSDEMQELNRRIVNTYDNKPFVSIFHHATNLLSAGFYNESFLLLCACCEGMFYHQCTELAKTAGIEKEYVEFSNSKKSRCAECELNKDNSKKIIDSGLPPTLFANVDFLQQHHCLSKQNAKEIKSLIHIVRNDNLRNSIAHGKDFSACRQDAENTLQALLKMQEVFVQSVKEKKGES